MTLNTNQFSPFLSGDLNSALTSLSGCLLQTGQLNMSLEVVNTANSVPETVNLSLQMDPKTQTILRWDTPSLQGLPRAVTMCEIASGWDIGRLY